MLTLKEALPEERQVAQLLYQQCGYRRGIAAQDRIFLARTGDVVCGVFRLAPEEGVTVLRGMQILPAFQRQGIGSKVLQYFFASASLGPCFCIPKSHLEGFYAACGFRQIDQTQAPAFLSARLAGYITEGLDVILMVRD